MISQNLKSVLGLLLVAAIGLNGVTGGIMNSKSSQLNKSAQMFLAKRISEMTITRLEKELRDFSLEQNPLATLFPPADDPACINPGTRPIDITIPDLLAVQGEVNLTSPAYVTGLSKIEDSFSFIAITGAIKWNFSVPTVEIQGDYDINLILDIGGYKTDILGNEHMVASVDEVFLKLDGKLNFPLTGTIGLTSLAVDLGFSNLAIEATGTTMNGTLVDWTKVSNNLQTYFDTIWNDETQPLITEAIRCSVDHAINNCTAAQLIGGAIDCLQIELEPECFEGLIPTVSVGKNVVTWAESCPASSTNPSESTDPSGTTEPPNRNENCTEGGVYYVPYPGDCGKYMICANYNLLPDVQQCPPGTLFDPDFAECNLETLVECKPTCPDLETSYFSHESNCTLYWLCALGTPTLRACPNGLVFDPKLEVCNVAEQVFCPNLCPPENANINLPHASNCSMYWLCIFGDPTLKTCPPGLLFDPEYHQCNSEDQVECET